jgi:hypothetical protein
VEQAAGMADYGIAAYGEQLKEALLRVQQVTLALYGAGDMNKTLANASLYLEAVGHVAVAWIWLQQAMAAARGLGGGATGDDAAFYQGKLQACRFFYRWELSKTGAWFDLLENLDTTALDMQDAWF